MSDVRQNPEPPQRKRVGPEDEAREDQMDDDGLGPADEDEDEPGLPQEG